MPLAIVFGIYIIVNGASGIGGGFQGGAVLSAALMLRWLAGSGEGNSLKLLRNIEKSLMLAILLFAATLLGQHMMDLAKYGLQGAWLLLMNLLIGFKVCCGLSIIFFRFVFYEAR
jgi:multicomponent Na+:H+ antiporter subunit B